MNLSKLKYIPRAVADSTKVLLHSSLPWKTRLDVCVALFKMKWMVWVKPAELFVEINLVGHSLQLFNDAASQTLLQEIWIDEVYAIKKDAMPVKKVLDAGANVGLFAWYTLNAIPSATISCFEPDSENFELLKLNSKVFGSNIECNLMAVGLRAGTKWLQQTTAGSLNKTFQTPGADIEVTFAQFETLVQQHFDLVKMDIEGAEWPLLQQIAEAGLLTKANYWMIELHEMAKHSTEWDNLQELCKRNGYKIEKVGCVWHLYKPMHA